jgi:hypothetical protein
MAVTIELLPLTTIEKASATPVYQDVSETIDTARYSSAVISARVLKSKDDAPVVFPYLKIEGSDDGQTFVEIPNIDITGAPESKQVHLNRNVGQEDEAYLWRLLRWVLIPTPTTGTDMEFCGRVTVVLK